MSGDAAFSDCGDLLPGGDVDDAKSAVAFIGDDQHSFGCGSVHRIKPNEGETEDCSNKDQYG